MKLKQRLALASFCGLLFFITKPLWSWDDAEWRPHNRKNHRLVHREDFDKLVHRENEGFLHSKLHHGEYEKRKAEAHNSVSSSTSAKGVAVSKSVETMKPHPNPLLTAKVAPPINPALLMKKPLVNNNLPSPAEMDKPLLTSNKVDNPEKSVAEVKIESEQPTAQQTVPAAPVKNFPNIKIDVVLTAEEIQAEMDKAKIDNDYMPAGKASPWDTARNWVRARLVYPQNHPQMGWILNHMSKVKIKKADVLPKGTQLKMLFYLEGNQKAVFKPKRYERDEILGPNSWDGFDRHNAEIAAFHLDRVLNFRRAPLTVGRKIHFGLEMDTVAADRLKTTFREKDGNRCFYGQCYYCKETELACADDHVMEGSLTLWFPDSKPLEKVRHPYQRTYKPDKKARWQTDEGYCNDFVKKTEPYNKGQRLLDIIDTSIFDFLIGNGDRHHYEVFKNEGNDAMVLLLDNAKAFGNYTQDDLSILAPLRQCCILRTSTFDRLAQLKNGLLTKLLTEAMKTDPLAPILHKKHIEAINRRMPIIFQHIQQCVNRNGKDDVLLEAWLGLKKE